MKAWCLSFFVFGAVAVRPDEVHKQLLEVDPRAKERGSYFVDVGTGEIKVYDYATSPGGTVQDDMGAKPETIGLGKGVDFNNRENLQKGLQVVIDKLEPVLSDNDTVFVFGTAGVRGGCNFLTSSEWALWASTNLTSIDGKWSFSVLTEVEEAGGGAMSVLSAKLAGVVAVVAPGSGSIQLSLIENDAILSTNSVKLDESSSLAKDLKVHLEKQQGEKKFIMIGSAPYVAKGVGLRNSIKPDPSNDLEGVSLNDAVVKMSDFDKKWCPTHASDRTCKKLVGTLGILSELKKEFKTLPDSANVKVIFARATKDRMLTLADGIASCFLATAECRLGEWVPVS